jgi:hypothetical protein
MTTSSLKFLLFLTLLFSHQTYGAEKFKVSTNVVSLINNINREERNREWPFSGCGNDHNLREKLCPTHWHCERGSCVPDEEDFWKYKIRQVEKVTINLDPKHELKKLILMPYSDLIFRNERYYIRVYVHEKEGEKLEEGMAVKLFPYSEDPPRYEIYSEEIGLYLDTVDGFFYIILEDN